MLFRSVVLVVVGSYILKDALRSSHSGKDDDESTPPLARKLQSINLPPMISFPKSGLRISLWFTLPVGIATGMLAATIAVGSLITATIPPSLGLILYGFVGNVSIGRLFLAGVIPGLMMMAGLFWEAGANPANLARVIFVSPLEAKGLEYDAVVVVSPDEIVTESPTSSASASTSAAASSSALYLAKS